MPIQAYTVWIAMERVVVAASDDGVSVWVETEHVVFPDRAEDDKVLVTFWDLGTWDWLSFSTAVF